MKIDAEEEIGEAKGFAEAFHLVRAVLTDGRTVVVDVLRETVDIIPKRTEWKETGTEDD